MNNDKIYTLILHAINYNNKALMSTVTELDYVRNINSEDRTLEQKEQLENILKSRKPFEEISLILEEIRRILWDVIK